MKNAVGREIPEEIKGYGKTIPFKGVGKHIPSGRKASPPKKATYPTRTSKVVKSLEDAIKAVELKDGMSVSFHHHLRNGDRVVLQVVEAIDKLGIRNITLVPTALFPTHRELEKYIRKGTISRIYGNINGPLGRAISKGIMEYPVVFRSHGGRARAIEDGDLHIDVAFIAAPSADHYGNLNGVMGPSSCGSLGYAFTDAMFADQVVAITDNLVDFPLTPISIPQIYVDYVVEVEHLGDPKGIVSGTTRITRDPMRLKIAKNAADLIEASGLLKDGFSFQTGAGGISLAVARFVREKMIEKKIKGSFGLGGITSYFVKMLEDGIFKTLFDVQCFDLEAVRSLLRNNEHIEISASFYANPHNAGCLVNKLDCVILGATEIDPSFNVNVNTEVDGALTHGTGGHSDTAAGSKLTIIVSPLIRGRIPTVVESVLTVTTPGETIDAFVCEYGIAINPRRKDLLEKAKEAKLPVVSIEELLDKAIKLVGKPEPLRLKDQIIGVIEYRDGTIIDVVYGIEDEP